TLAPPTLSYRLPLHDALPISLTIPSTSRAPRASTAAQRSCSSRGVSCPAEQAAPAVRDARQTNQQTTEGGNRSSRPQCCRYSPGRLAPYALARCSVLVVLVFVLVVIVDVVLIGVSGVIGIIVIRIGRIGLARVRSQLL